MTEVSEKLSTVEGLELSQAAPYGLQKWPENDQRPQNEAVPSIQESFPSGTSLSRRDWVALSRTRVKVVWTNDNCPKCGLTPSPECPCGAAVQPMEHIWHRCQLGPHCSDRDLQEANSTAQEGIQHWHNKTWWRWWWFCGCSLQSPFCPMAFFGIAVNRISFC